MQHNISVLPNQSSVNKDHVSEEITFSALRKSTPELEALAERVKDAQEKYKDACHAVSLKTGLLEQVIKMYINAVIKGNVAKHKQKAKQLTLLLEEFNE